jgi:hypothetical protein
MKKICSLIFSILFLNAFAQDVRDLVRFSETQVFGSARFEAMGGSFGALGADLSSASINPAGFGRYSSSTFGMGFQNTSILNKATFNQNVVQNSLNSFKLNNLGFVLTNDISERNRGFVFQQFGFSFNRVQDFKDSYTYSGQQFNSLLDYFCNIADQVEPNDLYFNFPFSSVLAWDTYAIDNFTNDNGTTSYSPRLNDVTNVIHRRRVQSLGGISEYNFTLSANYMNKLYIGGNLGLRTARFEENFVHHEIVTNTEGMSLDSFEYQYNLKTKGNGTNLKLGLIYLPVQSVRLGLSLHTPTFFELRDDFSANMVSYQKDITYRIDPQYVPVGNYKYRLRTPTKLIGSFAYVYSTKACFNADFELVNYKWAHLKTTKDLDYEPYDYSAINDESRPQLRTTVNIRLGGEINFNGNYFLRGGLALYPSAYDKNVNPTKGVKLFTGGFGIKWKNSSLDLALKVEHRNFNYYAFNESLAKINSFRNGIVFNYAFGF